MAQPNFWGDNKKANEIISNLKNLKSIVEPYLELERQFQELEALAGIIEGEDEKSILHLGEDLSKLNIKLKGLEFKIILSGRMDRSSAIVSINAGAGGTEACDWTSMLLRMYSKWAASRDFEVQQIDFLAGEEAGIKNITVMIKGEYA